MLTVYYTEIPSGCPRNAAAEYLLRQVSPSRAARASGIKNPEAALLSLTASRLFEMKASEILGAAPEDFGYIFGENGKPFLSFDADLSFSLSHSGNIAAAAVQYFRNPVEVTACGVDCEETGFKTGKADSYIKIAERYFGEKEQAFVKEAGTDGERVLRFAKIWTALEAHAKMTGRGIFGELPDKDLLVFSEGEPAGYKDGTALFSLDTGSGFISCAAETCGGGPVVFSEVPFGLLFPFGL